jgi:hypothetical protein
MFRWLVGVGAEQRVAWTRRRERSALFRSATAPVVRWLERGPIIVRGALPLGLLLEQEFVFPSHTQGELLMRGLLELPVQEALRRRLPPGGVFYDVGANVGSSRSWRRGSPEWKGS